jgi:opacity protein-like surface antigen
VKRNQALLFTNGNNFISSGSDRNEGWVYGGGFEYDLFGGWAITAEYLRIDLDAVDTLRANSTPVPGPVLTTTSDTDRLDLVRAGLTYRFW